MYDHGGTPGSEDREPSYKQLAKADGKRAKSDPLIIHTGLKLILLGYRYHFVQSFIYTCGVIACVPVTLSILVGMAGSQIAENAPVQDRFGNAIGASAGRVISTGLLVAETEGLRQSARYTNVKNTSGRLDAKQVKYLERKNRAIEVTYRR